MPNSQLSTINYRLRNFTQFVNFRAIADAIATKMGESYKWVEQNLMKQPRPTIGIFNTYLTV